MTESMARQWSDLPPEILSLISNHLFAGDYAAFKCVCKSWLSVCTISPPPLPPLTDSSASQYPQLMFKNHRTQLFNFFQPLCNASSYISIPDLPDIDIHYSKSDWLLVSDEGRSSSLFFFSPYIKQRIDLPDVPLRFDTMCFTSPPTSPRCLVFGFSNHVLGCMQIGILSISICDTNSDTDRRGVWNVKTYLNNHQFDFAYCSPVLCNGFVYCLSLSGNLGVFGPIDNIYDNNSHDDCNWTIHGKLSLPRLDQATQHYMVECDSEILLVFVCNSGDAKGVHVHRLDCDVMEWVEVTGLGDKMLFVCPFASFSEKALMGGVGNKVYFHMFYGDDGVFYSLATKMFHSFTGNCLRTDTYHMGLMMHSAWIKSCLQQY